MISNILSYLEQSAKRFPDRVAIADVSVSYTYGQLWERVLHAGSIIASRLGCVRRPIAVFTEHKAFDILAFLSVAYSGNFYVPIDPQLPKGRIEDILNTLSPASAVTDGDSYGIGTVFTADSLLRDCDTLLPKWQGLKDTDPLYVIFTSGSTGSPKGVVVSHRSVIDMAEQFTSTFSFNENSVFGNQAPFDFDVSVKDIYISLKVGGRVEILEKRLFMLPKALIERMNERRINTVIWAVPALKILATLKAFKKIKPEFLEKIMFSGEVMPPKTIDYFMEHYPDAEFVNLYGPTEITCNCTYYRVPHGSDTTVLAIGQPFDNCSVFLLDGENAAKDGEMGEICVSGSCLALGYYNAKEQTASAFVQNPLNTAYNELIYRTGDLGFVRDGLLWFGGRKDTQIKHMGHRIELAEIELCANAAEGVGVSACVYDEEGARIVLFYQGDAAADKLLLHIKGILPKYMLPNECVRVDSFAQTRTGKIDRKILLQLAKRR